MGQTQARMGMQWGGVDGCRFGWVLALLSRNGIVSLFVRKTFTEIMEECNASKLVLVDIPIGPGLLGDAHVRGIKLCFR